MASWERGSARVEERVLGQQVTMHDRGSVPLEKVSPDGLRAAWSTLVGSRLAVAVDGKVGPAFDEIGGILNHSSDIAWYVCADFSEDSRHAAYHGRRGGAWQAVIDGSVGAKYHGIRMDAGHVFPPKGARQAYAALWRGKWGMVIDGKLVGRYSAVSPPTWSDDGRRIAFVGTHAGSDELVVDGRVVAQAGRIDSHCLSFSPDARRFAYFEERPKTAVVVDGERRPLELGARCGRPVFSPDGRHVVYVVYADDGHDMWEHVAVDGELGPAYRLIAEPGFTPDGHVCYTGLKPHVGEVLVVGRQESPGYDRIETEDVGDPMGGSWPACPLAFSPDGLHSAYGVARDRKGWVVLDGQKGPTFLEVGEPVFSPDGRSVAYLARVGKDEWAVALNGKAGPTFREVWGKPLFGPNGERLAYVARLIDKGGKRQLVAVIDGKPSSPRQSVFDLSFSPDSRHVAYVARDGEVESVVADGQSGPQYDEVLRPRPSEDQLYLAFGPKGSVEYLARRGDTIYRVRQFPPGPGA
jgi:hypothetical protein